jgi:hypothetical protein
VHPFSGECVRFTDLAPGEAPLSARPVPVARPLVESSAVSDASGVPRREK